MKKTLRANTSIKSDGKSHLALCFGIAPPVAGRMPEVIDVMKDQNELEESVDRFLGFFEEKLSIIRETDFKDSNSLFRKILYVGLIDALAKTTSSPKKGIRKRVCSFIKNFADWEHHNRVSLPHLTRLLEKVPDPEFSAVRNYAYDLLNLNPE